MKTKIVGTNSTKRMLTGLITVVAMICLHYQAAANQDRAGMLHIIFNLAITNTGVEPDARGRIDWSLTDQGDSSHESQRLKLVVAKLNSNTAYQLVAFIGDNTNPTTIADFTTDQHGEFKIVYVKKAQRDHTSSAKLLPETLDPICNVRELNIINDSQQTVLRAQLNNPEVVKRAMNNTGFTPAAVGQLQIRASSLFTPFQLQTVGLTPSTDYRLTINGKVAKIYQSDNTGRLMITALPQGAPHIVDIQMLVLTDCTSNNIVLISRGLDLPCSTPTRSTVALTADLVRPTVRSTDPVNTATAVAVNKKITATFSETMDAATINTVTMTLSLGAKPIAGTVTYSGQTATFTPSSNLAARTTFTATITTGAKDLAGNALARNFVWSFTTAAMMTGQAPVVLGAASNFAVLSGSTVTNSGPTIVNGDLGVSPGTAVTGFLPGIVNGMTYTGVGSAAGQAQLALTTAYNDAAGRTLAPVSVSGNIGGLTLPPGLYKSISSLEISSGDLTLDAQGNENGVFIFQIASTLTTTAGRQVILSGGAKAANIFWQVGSSATLGTTSVFKGTILADQAITLQNGATLEGRALARIAAVTLDTNTVGLIATLDTTRPTVIATDPADAAINVAVNKRITATFSETMDASTINTVTMTLKQGTKPIAGKVTYSGVTATFTPSINMPAFTKLTVTISTAAKDLVGNSLASNFVWSFTTATAPTRITRSSKSIPRD